MVRVQQLTELEETIDYSLAFQMAQGEQALSPFASPPLFPSTYPSSDFVPPLSVIQDEMNIDCYRATVVLVYQMAEGEQALSSFGLPPLS